MSIENDIEIRKIKRKILMNLLKYGAWAIVTYMSIKLLWITYLIFCV